MRCPIVGRQSPERRSFAVGHRRCLACFVRTPQLSRGAPMEVPEAREDEALAIWMPSRSRFAGSPHISRRSCRAGPLFRMRSVGLFVRDRKR